MFLQEHLQLIDHAIEWLYAQFCNFFACLNNDM